MLCAKGVIGLKITLSTLLELVSVVNQQGGGYTEVYITYIHIYIYREREVETPIAQQIKHM